MNQIPIDEMFVAKVWVKCPFCRDEVSKLRPCTYWHDAKDIKTNVCVECAESVKGLKYLQLQYPTPSVDVRFELLPVYKSPLDPRYINERSYKAKVFLGDWSFTVWPKSSRLSVLEDKKTPDFEKSYDNTFQVWFALKEIFEKGADSTDTTKFKKGKWK
jgi:hypothetical protein